MRKYIEPEIKAKVETALGMLLKNDNFLLEHDVNERSISHKLAEYLQQLFPDYHVDCEYNRMHSGQSIDKKYIQKRLHTQVNETISTDDSTGYTVFPDIIIHRRGYNVDNLVVIEMKKRCNNKRRSFDKEKLAAYKKDLDYQFSVYLELGIGKRCVSIFEIK